MFIAAWIMTAAQAVAPKPEIKYVGALWQDGKDYLWGPAPCVDQAMAALEIALTQIPLQPVEKERETGITWYGKVVDRSAQLDDAVCRARECADLEREIRPAPEASVPGVVPDARQ